MPRPSLLALPFAATLLLPGCGQGHPELQNLGSDTMLEVAGAWAQAYHDVHPQIVVSVSGGGSGTGIANLIAGDVDIANSSRHLKDSEVEAAKKHGHTPVQHHVGYDGIAIYVHKDNPIVSITLEQLREMFGDGGSISRWSQLGVEIGAGNGDDDRIVLASRQNNSGTYEYFREAVLGGDSGRFKSECNNLNGSKDVVDFCGKTRSAIGYSGLAYATKAVRVVPVAKTAAAPAVVPDAATVLDGSYPISRPLFMYTNGEPTGEVKLYLDWIKSDAGQRVLQKCGYPPLRPL
ncbi:MAG: phosphate ABC transporter substrate-binding protein [Planctomycetes bacterium]|nr:phosphate ABC transporter substrate-binding protein [Planctomycetota bacterium]